MRVKPGIFSLNNASFGPNRPFGIKEMLRLVLTERSTYSKCSVSAKLTIRHIGNAPWGPNGAFGIEEMVGLAVFGLQTAVHRVFRPAPIILNLTRNLTHSRAVL